ncbi:hypothetical protein [Bacillus sp. 123MFChir2]|uniref:hypothetical protein n=1 Tax=Bacillus sp. 123MFChir2 TaxID=1169144 RepID=UPI000363A18B|nr:hypothetical protein [Bacillus sp. 123MFChir2]
MKLYTLSASILIMVLFATGCSNIQTSRPNDSKSSNTINKQESSIDKDTITFNMGKTDQLVRLLEFINNTKKGQQDKIKIQIITSSKKINRSLQYNGEQITYHNEKGQTLTCKNIDSYKDASGMVYEVNSCEGEVSSEWVFQTSTAEHEAAQKQLPVSP